MRVSKPRSRAPGAGRRGMADAQLQRALAFWRSVAATAYIREAEALLAATALLACCGAMSAFVTFPSARWRRCRGSDGLSVRPKVWQRVGGLSGWARLPGSATRGPAIPGVRLASAAYTDASSARNEAQPYARRDRRNVLRPRGVSRRVRQGLAAQRRPGRRSASARRSRIACWISGRLKYL
jgi:hypothetical protein